MDLETFISSSSKISTLIMDIIVSEYKNLVNHVNSLLLFINSHFNNSDRVLFGCLHLGIIIAVSSILIIISKTIRKYLGKENVAKISKANEKTQVNKVFTKKADQSFETSKPKWKKPEPIKKSEVIIQNKPDHPKPNWQKPQPINKTNINSKEMQKNIKSKWKKLEGVNKSLSNPESKKKGSSIICTHDINQDDFKTKTETDTTNINENTKASWFGFGKAKEENSNKLSSCEEEKKTISESFMNMWGNKDNVELKKYEVTPTKHDINQKKGDEESEKEDLRPQKGNIEPKQEAIKTEQDLRTTVHRVKLRADETIFESHKGQTSAQKRGFIAGRLRNKDFEMFETKDKTDEPIKIIHKKKLITLDQVINKDTSSLDQITDWKEKELDKLREARPKSLLKRWNPIEKHAEENVIRHQELEEIKQAYPTPLVKRWKPEIFERNEKTKSMDIPNKLKIDNFLIDTSKEEESKKGRLTEVDQICESRPTSIAKRWKPKIQEPIERSKSGSCAYQEKLGDNNWNINDKSTTQDEETRMKTSQEIEQHGKERAATIETEFGNISENNKIQLRRNTEKELQEIISTRSKNPEEEAEIGRKKEIELKKQTRRELEYVKKSRQEVPKNEGHFKTDFKTVTSAELNEVQIVQLNASSLENEEIKDKDIESRKERDRELEEVKVENELINDKLNQLNEEKGKELEEVNAARVCDMYEVVDIEKESLKAKKFKKLTGIEEKEVKAARLLISDTNIYNKSEKMCMANIDKSETAEILSTDKLQKSENIEKDVSSMKYNTNTKQEQGAQLNKGKIKENSLEMESKSPKTIKMKTILNNHDEEKGKARTEEVNRRAKELAELTLKLEKTRESQNTPGSDEDNELPALQKIEVNRKLQELAQMAKCGTLDIALAIAAESVASWMDVEGESGDALETEKSNISDNREIHSTKENEDKIQEVNVPRWQTPEELIKASTQKEIHLDKVTNKELKEEEDARADKLKFSYVDNDEIKVKVGVKIENENEWQKINLPDEQHIECGGEIRFVISDTQENTVKEWEKSVHDIINEDNNFINETEPEVGKRKISKEDEEQIEKSRIINKLEALKKETKIKIEADINLMRKKETVVLDSLNNIELLTEAKIDIGQASVAKEGKEEQLNKFNDELPIITDKEMATKISLIKETEGVQLIESNESELHEINMSKSETYIEKELEEDVISSDLINETKIKILEPKFAKERGIKELEEIKDEIEIAEKVEKDLVASENKFTEFNNENKTESGITQIASEAGKLMIAGVTQIVSKAGKLMTAIWLRTGVENELQKGHIKEKERDTEADNFEEMTDETTKSSKAIFSDLELVSESKKGSQNGLEEDKVIPIMIENELNYVDIAKDIQELSKQNKNDFEMSINNNTHETIVELRKITNEECNKINISEEDLNAPNNKIKEKVEVEDGSAKVKNGLSVLRKKTETGKEVHPFCMPKEEEEISRQKEMSFLKETRRELNQVKKEIMKQKAILKTVRSAKLEKFTKNKPNVVHNNNIKNGETDLRKDEASNNEEDRELKNKNEQEIVKEEVNISTNAGEWKTEIMKQWRENIEPETHIGLGTEDVNIMFPGEELKQNTKKEIDLELYNILKRKEIKQGKQINHKIQEIKENNDIDKEFDNVVVTPVINSIVINKGNENESGEFNITKDEDIIEIEELNKKVKKEVEENKLLHETMGEVDELITTNTGDELMKEFENEAETKLFRKMENKEIQLNKNFKNDIQELTITEYEGNIVKGIEDVTASQVNKEINLQNETQYQLNDVKYKNEVSELINENQKNQDIDKVNLSIEKEISLNKQIENECMLINNREIKFDTDNIDICNKGNEPQIDKTNRLNNINEVNLHSIDVSNQIRKVKELEHNTEKLLEKSRAARLYVMQTDYKIKQQRVMELKKEIIKELEEVKAARFNLVELSNNQKQNKIAEIRNNVVKELEAIKVARSHFIEVDEDIKSDKVSEFKKARVEELEAVKAVRLHAMDLGDNIKHDKVSEMKCEVAKELEEVKVARLQFMNFDDNRKTDKVSELKANIAKELEEVKVARLYAIYDKKFNKTYQLENNMKKELEDIKAARLNISEVDTVIKKQKCPDIKEVTAKEAKEMKASKIDVLNRDVKKVMISKEEVSISNRAEKKDLRKEQIEKLSDIEQSNEDTDTLNFYNTKSFEKSKKGIRTSNEKISEIETDTSLNIEEPESKEISIKEPTLIRQDSQRKEKQGVKAKVQKIKEGIFKTSNKSKFSKSKSKKYNHEEAEKARNKEVERRTKILAELALDLQRSREENNMSPILQVEINQKLQELAQLAECGTLDAAIDMTAVSVQKYSND